MYDRTGRLTRKLTCKGMRGVVPETFIDREYAYSGQDELLKKRHSRQGETAQAGAGSVVPFNRITSYRGLHYRYDEYGRVVEKRGRNGTQHYRWDAEHRLTEVAVIRGSTVRRYGYVYDAPGRRVEKHELDAEGKPYNRTTFLWDGMRLAQECRLGRSSSLYIYSDQGSHEPLARVDRAAPGEADEVLYYHTDVNGAPEEMTDGGGNIVWEAGYQVWGNLTHEKETRPVQQNLRFQGQYLDRETGLHYNLYRFYDPDIGKFISGDPIGLKGGINLYQYAPNPIRWIDPLGLDYTTWQIHSPGYGDVVQKGLHFYAPGGVELSVRPDNKGGITFTNAIPNEAGSPKVTKAIALAKEHFEKDVRFRNDILNKANEAVQSVLDHAKRETGSLRDLANGRSREFRDIARNVERHNTRGGCV